MRRKVQSCYVGGHRDRQELINERSDSHARSCFSAGMSVIDRIAARSSSNVDVSDS